MTASETNKANKANKAKRAVVGYVRVSTARQADEGVSLEAQHRKLELYAELHDLELIAVEIDAGVSAKTLNRPALQSALARLKAGEAEGLIVAKLDRLTRSVKDLGELVETYFADRYSLLSVQDSIDTKSAAGRLVLNVLACVAQWEREATGERTAEALRHIRDNEGATLGGEALGWRRTDKRDDHGRQVVAAIPAEATTARRIHELRSQGLGYRAIAERMNAEGHPTKRGGKWHRSTIAKVLSRPAPPPAVAPLAACEAPAPALRAVA